MIVGIGTDLIEIERIKKACEKEAFLSRVYTERERRQAGGKASVLAFAEPLTATLLGVVAFGEVPDGFGWLGVILLFGALVLLQMPQKQRKAGKIPNIL